MSRLLPQTLLLRHRGVLIGKLHTTPVSGADDTLQIGGFVVAENHQDSQQGQLLHGEALARLRDRGCSTAVAITASDRSRSLFTRLGGVPEPTGAWQASVLERAAQRYALEERGQVQLFEFPLKKPAGF